MPKEFGYFHPEREEPTEASRTWLAENGLSMRSIYLYEALDYQDFANYVDDISISRLTDSPDVDTSEQDRVADTLRLVSNEVVKMFRKMPDKDVLCIFVDEYEKFVIEVADEYWRIRNAPTRSVNPSEKYL